ncbi:hypothetical protein CFC21_022717 [Triticum aestivum]|uniref:DUF6598 domain-containing protein n=2 Tax=Triticum aestivum TaxID=4565 RepID=A0A3B6C392_WHEAT|nr:uncharacterized protein LOC123044412 [Triticum aestivum]KAF7007823.1 hypothetical protein CFC21_022717 [Triticum aestivum]
MAGVVEGGEERAPGEMATEETTQPEILKMKIASLLNLLSEKQSDVLSCGPEIVSMITSLNSELASQKLARDSKPLVPPEVSSPKRPKMADQGNIGQSNTDTQSVSSQVSSVAERGDQKEIESGKIKPASRFKSNSQQVCVPSGGEDEEERLNCQFTHIMQQTDALCDELASMASTPNKTSAPIISSHMVSDLGEKTSRLMQICKVIFCESVKGDEQVPYHSLDNQRTKEDSVEMSGLTMDNGKSSTQCADKQTNKKGMGGTMELLEDFNMFESDDEDEDEEMTQEQLAMSAKFREEAQVMEARLVEALEQDDNNTPSCYRMTHLSLSYQPEEKEEQDEVAEAEVETDITKSAKEEMEMEDRLFANAREGWEYACGWCGNYEDMTTLSPMHFTHCTPGIIPGNAITGSTLQIYSIRIGLRDEHLKWPLYVYGIVAARDAVDYNRNLLYFRPREDCQKLTLEHPFLCLTGPSRAIVALDEVDLEVQLKVKGTTRSLDRALISRRLTYSGGYQGGLDSFVFTNCLCTVEFSLERLTETVQATILGVRVVEGGPWPFDYGGRVICSSTPQDDKVMATNSATDPLSRQVVLVDSDGGEMPRGSDGYLDLSRHVVSVELEEILKFVIQVYTESGDIQQYPVNFSPKHCNIEKGKCLIGASEVEITIAWSRLVQNKMDILFEGHV